MKLIHGMGLFAISGLLAACSLTAMEDGPLLSIRLEDQSEGAEAVQSAKVSRVTPQVSGSPVPPPTTVSGFDCIGINVLGPGIPDSSKNPETNLAGIFDQLLKRQSYCSYRGILAGPLSTTATVPQELSMIVPPGNTRMIQLVGLVNRNGSNDCQVEFTPGMSPPVDANGNSIEGDAFELGRAVVDLFQDRTVSIVPVWNGLSAADQDARRLDCGDGNNTGPSPTPSFGIGSFTPITGIATPRAQPAVAYDARLAPSRVQVVGGDATGTSQWIDVSNRTWSAFTTTGLNATSGSAVVPRTSGTSHLGLIGGAASPANAEIRTFDGTSWSAAATIPFAQKAGYSSPLVDGGSTYFFGAWSGGAPFANVFKYIHGTDTFQQLGNLQAGRLNAATAVISPGNLIAVGGEDGSGTSLNTCDKVIAGAISACAAYPFTVSGLAIAGIPGNKAFAFGGYTSQTGVVRTEAYIYDLASNTWAAATPLATGIMNARAFLVNGGSRVMIVGGQSTASPASVNSNAYFYNLATGTWHGGASLITPRSSFSAVQVPDGRILLVGGVNAGGTSVSDAEIWQP